MYYAIFDFSLQIIAQLPLVSYPKWFESIGFRKIWTNESTYGVEMSYEQLINNSDTFVGLEFNKVNFCMQLLNCMMIAVISLQTEIFESPGYIKFVTQTDGSMDLLM